jgi:hypothetical protein
MMPKPPIKNKKLKMYEPEVSAKLAIRELAQHLDHVRIGLQEAVKVLDRLNVKLYTGGLDEAGPIVESKDDIPF